MTGRLNMHFNPRILLATVAWAIITCVQAHDIRGTLTIPDDGCDKVRVFLCDGASGEPLCKANGQRFTTVLGTTNETAAMNWWFAIPDAKGRFQFTNVPAGKYIVVGQAWNSPVQPTNFTKFRCETVHLLGRAEITVPANPAPELKLTAPSTRMVKFDQGFGNDDGFLMLSTRPQRGDAVMGWLSWGPDFITHLIGHNWMPGGRTTVHGLPEDSYASIFANDNSPGFGSTRVGSETNGVVKMLIVAGWSDGYKTPPANLSWLVELVETNKFDLDELLGIPKLDPAQNFMDRQQSRARALLSAWDKQIVLPTGQKVLGVDLMVAAGYARLRGH